MTKQLWPAWRFNPSGHGAVFQSPEEVPEGWMTRDELNALEGAQVTAETVVETGADKASQDALKAALTGLPGAVLDAIAECGSLIEAATAAIGILASNLDEKTKALDAYVDAFHPGESFEQHQARKASEEVSEDLNKDGRVEPNRDEIKKALDGLKVDYDGRLATDKLQALLAEAQKKAGA